MDLTLIEEILKQLILYMKNRRDNRYIKDFSSDPYGCIPIRIISENNYFSYT